MKKLSAVILGLGIIFSSGNVSADPINDFVACTKSGKTEAECYRSEARRYVSQIEKLYEKYGKDEYFNDYKVDKTQANPEKFRKLMNMWKLYVQNYCNLLNYTNEKEGYTDEDKNKCLYDLAIVQLNEIESIESIRQSDRF